jgi:hypothetical protein
MKTKIQINLILLLLTICSLTNGCKKEDLDPNDPAYPYVGKYSFSNKNTGDINNNVFGDLEIFKSGTNGLKIKGWKKDVYYTIYEDYIEEDPGQTVDLPVWGGGTATFTEHSTGNLKGETLIIDGTQTRSGYHTQYFKLTAEKKKGFLFF